MNIILLGPQFSGKGTLARQMVRDFGFVHLSLGDLFRENIKNGTELGKIAKTYMDKGVLVPNEVSMKILEERVKEDDCKKNGVILDGVPRSVEQAEIISKFLDIDAVILLTLPREEIMRRCMGRRTCSKCGEIYNTSFYDKNTCKLCGSPLFRRDDDNPEAIKTRLEVYDKTTTPLINFYADRLFEVDSSKDPETTYKPVKNFLKERLK